MIIASFAQPILSEMAAVESARIVRENISISASHILVAREAR